jgi:hypothetical protein
MVVHLDDVIRCNIFMLAQILVPQAFSHIQIRFHIRFYKGIVSHCPTQAISFHMSVFKLQYAL